MVSITFKLFSHLADYLPEHYQGNQRVDNTLVIEVSDDTSITDVIEQFKLPPKLVHLVLVNGTYIEPEDRISRTFNEGEELAIWPRVFGG